MGVPIIDTCFLSKSIVDRVDFPTGKNPMNTGVVTTGLKPLTLNSTETFVLNPTLDQLFWNLTGGTVTLKLTDPSGTPTTINATISNGVASANWTVAGASGAWLRAWTATDSSGIVQVSQPISFNVISSPV